MYKVFYNERIIFLCPHRLPEYESDQSIIYYYNSREELLDYVNLFYFKSSATPSLFIIHEDIELLFASFVSYHQYIYAAGGIVKKRGGDILFIYRFNRWDLPKGKVEPNEDIEQAALREVEEECGISGHKIVKQLSPVYHVYLQNDQMVLKKTFWYEMLLAGKHLLVPQISEGISEVAWKGKKDRDLIYTDTYASLADVLKESGF